MVAHLTAQCRCFALGAATPQMVVEPERLSMDEATAALDSKAESEVQGAIDRLSKNRTVLCIAHRLSTLRSMDRVIVLSHGKIIEEGNFDELMAQVGVFSGLARAQGITA